MIMKSIRRQFLLVGAFVGSVVLTNASAQTPTPESIATTLGFTDADLVRIKDGEILTRDLKEGSDKELAGALMALFKTPVAELAEIALEAKMLDTDPTVRAHREWAPFTLARPPAAS
jgi:hypothetical protein